VSTPILPRMLGFSDVVAYLQPKLAAREFSPMPIFLPIWDDTSAKSPTGTPVVVLTVGGGAGLTNEETFDRPFIALRVVSRAQDYAGGEALAMACDADLCAFDGSAYLGLLWALYITRTGGRPQLLTRENERYHFTASYIAAVESGV
jgi:pectin methylesterase-like acyl-CoA thioesterase